MSDSLPPMTDTERLRAENDRLLRKLELANTHRQHMIESRRNLERKVISWREAAEEARSECAALAVKVDAAEARVAELEELKCAVCGMRVAHLNRNGHVIGWGCADGNECKPEDGSGMPHAPAQNGTVPTTSTSPQSNEQPANDSTEGATE